MLSFVRDSENYLDHLQKLQDRLQNTLRQVRKLEENRYKREAREYANIAL